MAGGEAPHHLILAASRLIFTCLQSLGGDGPSQGSRPSYVLGESAPCCEHPLLPQHLDGHSDDMACFPPHLVRGQGRRASLGCER